MSRLARFLAAGVAVLAISPAPAGAQPADPAAERGRALFAEGCASCHGLDGRGVGERGPSLLEAGAASADFYLSTGRMPLSRPDVQPYRHDPVYTPRQREALVAYVASLGPDGPPIPDVRPQRGDLDHGRRLFADLCSGCHQIAGQGGVAPGFVAPALTEATPTQVGEAIRVGPYTMPRFGPEQLDDHDVDSIARYVEAVVQSPADRGGWGIGHIGPIPEGLVVWLVGGLGLVLVARVIGERSP